MRRDLRVKITATLVLGCAAFWVLGGPSIAAAQEPPPQGAQAIASLISALEPPAWAAFRHTWESITGYDATVTLFEREGMQAQNSVFDYTFSKPSNATLHFTEGTNAGATVVWNGGDTVLAHRGSGFFALLKKKFALHDPQVMTNRGSSIDQLSFAAILTHFQGVPGTVTQNLGPTILGVPTTVMTLIPISPITDNGFTRETLHMSTISGLPVRLSGYEGDTLVLQVDFANVEMQRDLH